MKQDQGAPALPAASAGKAAAVSCPVLPDDVTASAEEAAGSAENAGSAGMQVEWQNGLPLEVDNLQVRRAEYAVCLCVCVVCVV